MVNKKSVKKALSPPKDSKKKKEPNPNKVKEQITGIKQPGRRTKQEKTQAIISGDDTT